MTKPWQAAFERALEDVETLRAENERLKDSLISEQVRYPGELGVLRAENERLRAQVERLRAVLDEIATEDDE